MKAIVVLISGNGSNLQTIIDGCANGSIPGYITGVIANKANAYGLKRAVAANIPTTVISHKDYQDRQQYDAVLKEAILQYGAELIVLAGFMRILTPEFVQFFSGKLLNIHPSLLPKYQGLDTHQRAIDAGDAEHGCSVHFVTEQLDGGPVVLQAKVPIFPGDDASMVAARVHEQEHLIYPLVVRWFCQNRLQQRANEAWLDGLLLSVQGYAQDEDDSDVAR
ncbi:phosphoribosylglycinamide formyltransferase [Alishewanella tabrizica]|uniref:Phosphoribosylglycinamide formyltransferase n=1 Tax=Alishewanella tabrizica TaxID=671278 RepID=A0ABQ2WCR3_9ALTE|nr:phosphoribosylglycinamide formyltransferase [Alishewanella tabrizica]GGW49258.1 phosphoribosylglycinamide formyltransferase [Alishewanella tabrizica]